MILQDLTGRHSTSPFRVTVILFSCTLRTGRTHSLLLSQVPWGLVAFRTFQSRRTPKNGKTQSFRPPQAPYLNTGGTRWTLRTRFTLYS